MTKAQFIQMLSDGIAPLTILERQEILSDYEEHFRQGLENGKSEAEICDSLGDPVAIARDYLDESMQRQYEQQFRSHQNETKNDASGQQSYVPPTQKRGIGTQIALAFVLIFCNLIFIVPIVAGIFAALIGCIVAGIAIVVAGIVVIFSILYGWIYFVAGLALLCFGILFCIGFILLMGLFCKAIGMYIKGNVRIVSGRS